MFAPLQVLRCTRSRMKMAFLENTL